MNLFEKIQAVANEVMNIEKDMTVGSGSYSYKAISDNAVTLAIKKAEKRHRIVSIPIKQELVSSEVIPQVKSGKESLLFVDNIKMTVKIVDLDKTEDFIEVESFGKGIDNGDKGFGKASTYARKYALLNAYKVATGEDPDAEKSETIEATTKDEKREAVTNYCAENNDVQLEVLKHFNVTDMADLSQKQIDVIYTQFKQKKRI